MPAENGLGWQDLSHVIQHSVVIETSLRAEIREFKDLLCSVCSCTGSACREGSPKEESGDRNGFQKLQEHKTGTLMTAPLSTQN